MMELVQITAPYSNAVLVAVLPYISDFSTKLELPISTPITASQVNEFKCDPRKGQTGGLVTLTNGFRFTFLDGRVCVYRSPQSYFSLQDPDLIPKFYGPVTVKQNEALKTAREVIKKLGYTETMFHTEIAPQITQPEKIGTNRVARYRFKWLDPKWPVSKNSGGNLQPALLDVEVDASTCQIQMLSIAGRDTRRPTPKVDVVPPSLQAAQPIKQKLSGGRKTEAANPAYSAAFLQAILPRISGFAEAIDLPIPLPLSTNQVDSSQYLCRIIDGQPIGQIFLKNGDRFNYQHGHIMAFYAHDAFRKFPDHGKIEDFLGKINMNTNEAITLCEHALKSLGYNKKLPKAFFGGSTFIGTNEFSRYIFYWRHPEDDSEFASIEVDMQQKKIKSVYCDDASLWRDPPKIDVPMLQPANEALTNAASIKLNRE